MKHYLPGLLLLLFVPLFTACQKEQSSLVYLETADSTSAVKLENAYYSLGERFPELREQLLFNIDIPEPVQLYDKGETDGVVRFSDISGKNLITLETHLKEQPGRYYQQYLHDICTNLTELSSFHEYEETFTVGGCAAKRLDFRQNTGTETRLLSYWFIELPDTARNRGGVCVVSVESTAENIEMMLRIVATFRAGEA